MNRPVATQLAGAGLTATRLRYDGADLERGPGIPPADAFSAIVQLRDFKSHRLWRGNRLIYQGGHAAGVLAITHLGDEWSCHHRSPFDNLRFHIPRAILDECARDLGLAPPDGLDAPAGGSDPVLAGLAGALLPAMARPEQAHPLFVEHVLLAAAAHIVRVYGNSGGAGKGKGLRQERRGALSRRQVARAREFLAAHSDQDVSIVRAAEACGLSRGHFITAFRETIGRTPYQWLLQHRVARAQAMLLGDQPIVEIAAKCGFADQSHMTRVFTGIAGMPPGAWRRRHKG